MDPGRYRQQLCSGYQCPRLYAGWTSVSRVCDASGVYERLEYQFLSKRQAIIVRRKLKSRDSLCGHRWVDFGGRVRRESSSRLRAATSMPNLHLNKVELVCYCLFLFACLWVVLAARVNCIVYVHAHMCILIG